MTVHANDAHPFPIWNARYRAIFPLLDADGDPVSPSAPDTELSQDTGTFADATNEATEIATSSGVVYVDLIATEMDTTSTVVKCASTGAKSTIMTLYPLRMPVLRTGTAQAGAATTITLDAGASAVDDFYNGCYVNITNDSPANARGQARLITDYVGSTKVATVATWGTNPSNASTFEILVPPGMQGNLWAGTVVPDPNTVGYPIVTVKDGTGAGEIDTASGRVAITEAQIDQIVDEVLDEDMTAHQTQGTLGQAIGDPGADADTIWGLANTNLDAAISTRATPAQVNAEVLDVVNVDTFAEPTGVPAATQTIRQMLQFMYSFAFRNKITVTSTKKTYYDDGDVSEFEKDLADDGTTYTESEANVI